MKKSKPIFFAVCRYIPDILRGESINVGVLTHVPELKYVKFHKTKNLSRIRTFDDEVDSDVLRALLDSLEYQFNSNRASELEGISEKDFLKNELVYFVNQIQFSEVRVLNSDPSTLDEDIKDLIDIYLYYDKKKSERIDANRVRSLATKMVRQSDLKDYIDRHPAEKNVFDQEPFDFSLNIGGERTYIKAVTFDYKNRNKFYNEIKSLLFDLNYFKENNLYNIKIVINNTEINEDYEKAAYNLLNEEVDVFTLEEFSKFVYGEGNKNNRQLELFN